MNIVTNKDSLLPLVLVLNARSVYNKVDNVNKMIGNILPDCAMVSESWGRRETPVSTLLTSPLYTSIGYYREKVFSSKGVEFI